MTRRRTAQPVRLDRDRILEAAAAIVGAEGLPALTMRRIGTELGADPTAVYRHFRSKRELLATLADRLFSTEPELDPAASWQERLRQLTAHALGRYRAHLDLGLLLAGQPDDLPGLVRVRDLTLQLLVEAGLDLPQAALMSQVCENHVVGCGLFFAVSGWNTPGCEESLAGMRRAYALLPADVAPLARQAAPHLFPPPDDVFDHTTNLLIDAIERIAAESGDATPEAVAVS